MGPLEHIISYECISYVLYHLMTLSLPATQKDFGGTLFHPCSYLLSEHLYFQGAVSHHDVFFWATFTVSKRR